MKTQILEPCQFDPPHCDGYPSDSVAWRRSSLHARARTILLGIPLGHLLSQLRQLTRSRTVELSPTRQRLTRRGRGSFQGFFIKSLKCANAIMKSGSVRVNSDPYHDNKLLDVKIIIVLVSHIAAVLSQQSPSNPNLQNNS